LGGQHEKENDKKRWLLGALVGLVMSVEVAQAMAAYISLGVYNGNENPGNVLTQFTGLRGLITAGEGL
jgi:hypothetical protein